MKRRSQPTAQCNPKWHWRHQRLWRRDNTAEITSDKRGDMQFVMQDPASQVHTADRQSWQCGQRLGSTVASKRKCRYTESDATTRRSTRPNHNTIATCESRSSKSLRPSTAYRTPRASRLSISESVRESLPSFDTECATESICWEINAAHGKKNRISQSAKPLPQLNHSDSRSTRQQLPSIFQTTRHRHARCRSIRCNAH